jgi:hypothetical protein
MIKNGRRYGTTCGICRIAKFFQLYEFKRAEATLIWMKRKL